MSRVATALVVSLLLGATTACSATASTRPECRGGSILSSIDPDTGTVAWEARLTQRSEQPLQAQDGTVVVTAPCGVGVVDLASGEVLYDDTTPGDPVGVTGHRLFTLDEHVEGGIPVTSFVLGSGRPGGSFSTNTPYRAATVADGSLVTLYGDVLEASDHPGAGPSWWTQLPPTRNPRLLSSGHRLLVTADDGSTYAVDLADGTLDWRSIPSVASRFYSLRLTTVPGTVLTAAVTEDQPSRRFVYASAAASGRLSWSRPALGVLGADRDVTVLRTVTAVEAVDTTTGALRWRQRVPRVDVHAEVPQAALNADTIVVPQPGSPALALDRRTGRVRWRGPETPTAIALCDVVVVLAADGVTAIDAHTGAVRWSRAVERVRQELAAAPDGQVLLLDSDLVPHLGA